MLIHVVKLFLGSAGIVISAVKRHVYFGPNDRTRVTSLSCSIHWAVVAASTELYTHLLINFKAELFQCNSCPNFVVIYMRQGRIVSFFYFCGLHCDKLQMTYKKIEWYSMICISKELGFFLFSPIPRNDAWTLSDVYFSCGSVMIEIGTGQFYFHLVLLPSHINIFISY